MENSSNIIKLFHGTTDQIKEPVVNVSRADIDFGVGFYTTPDKYMAKKWAVRKSNHLSVVNCYELDITNLKIKYFGLDGEWLDFVINNRSMMQDERYNEYDVLVGAVADDKLFATIEQYEIGLLSKELTIEILNCMKLSNQYVLKTEKALEHLEFDYLSLIDEEERLELVKSNRADRNQANKLTQEMIKESNNFSKSERIESRGKVR